MKGESCKGCRFFMETEPNKQLQRQTICRRYPPQASIVPTPQGIATINTLVTVQPDGWCGEYRPGVTLSTLVK